jgi:hypothetical protein
MRINKKHIVIFISIIQKQKKKDDQWLHDKKDILKQNKQKILNSILKILTDMSANSDSSKNPSENTSENISKNKDRQD